MKNNKRKVNVLKGMILCLALSIISLYEIKDIDFKEDKKEVGIMLFQDVKDFDMSKINIKINTKDKVIANEEFDLEIVIENNSSEDFNDCYFKAKIDKRLEIIDNDSVTHINEEGNLLWYLSPDVLQANTKYRINLKLKTKKDVKVNSVLTNEFILPSSNTTSIDITPKNVKNEITIIENKVDNPNTGFENYIFYVLGGILVTGIIVIISKNNRKVYKI